MREIVYVYHSFYPYTRDGGPNYSCKMIVEALARKGVRLSVVTSRGTPRYALNDSDVEHGRHHFSGFGIDIGYHGTSSRKDPRLPWAVYRAGRNAILHINEMWSTTLLCGLLRRTLSSRTRLVISPNGMLQGGSMAQGRSGHKRLTLSLLRPLLRRAHWHVASTEEGDAVRELGLGPVPIYHIPNPVPFDEQRRPVSPKKGFLCLGRIDPVKGIDLLLGAYFAAWRQRPDLDDLTLAGPEENLTFVDAASGFPPELLAKVHYLGEVRGERKHDLLAGSRVLVNVSHSENFGMSIAEALEHGTPVLACEGSPWQEINDLACGSHGPRDEAGVARRMLEFQDRDQASLSEMGARGRAWIGRRFRPEIIATKYAEMYTQVDGI